MERYVFFDPTRISPGLHVIGVPTAEGLVWIEITPAEYDAATVSECQHYFYKSIPGMIVSLTHSDLSTPPCILPLG